MPIINLNEVDSTNAYIKRKCITSILEDFTVVTAELQTEGRGQMGTLWRSDASKNLTCSIYKDVSFLDTDKQFYISMVTSIAVIEALKTLQIPKLAIKWPNDILSEGKKIGGILIENIIKYNTINASIIGLGLNVNQKFFPGLPKASSLHILTGKLFEREEIIDLILKYLEIEFKHLKARHFEAIKINYESLLFRLQKPSTFETHFGKQFTGYIKGITDDGKLNVLVENDRLKTFDLKEIRLLY